MQMLSTEDESQDDAFIWQQDDDENKSQDDADEDDVFDWKL